MGLPPAWGLDGGCLKILTVKTYDLTKHFTGARIWADTLDQDRDRWQLLANAVMNTGVPQDV